MPLMANGNGMDSLQLDVLLGRFVTRPISKIVYGSSSLQEQLTLNAIQNHRGTCMMPQT